MASDYQRLTGVRRRLCPFLGLRPRTRAHHLARSMCLQGARCKVGARWGWPSV